MAPIEMVGEHPQQLWRAIQALQYTDQRNSRSVDGQRPEQPLHAVARKPQRSVVGSAFPPGSSHQPIAHRCKTQNDGQIFPECPQRSALIMGLRQPLNGLEIIDLDTGSEGIPFVAIT
jgi:hypothetical protein